MAESLYIIENSNFQNPASTFGLIASSKQTAVQETVVDIESGKNQLKII